MELKPCPFCGGNNLEVDNLCVACADCFSCGPTDKLDGVMDAWNMRPTPQTPRDVVEAMVDGWINHMKEFYATSIENEFSIDGLPKRRAAAMQAALTAAASMGYTLAPDERTLPELEEIKRGFTFILDISQEELPHTKVGSGAEVALRHIHRRALERLNAISKIDGGKG